MFFSFNGQERKLTCFSKSTEMTELAGHTLLSSKQICYLLSEVTPPTIFWNRKNMFLPLFGVG